MVRVKGFGRPLNSVLPLGKAKLPILNWILEVVNCPYGQASVSVTLEEVPSDRRHNVKMTSHCSEPREQSPVTL